MGDKKRKLPKLFGKEVTYNFLNGVHAVVMKAGIENARMKIFKAQLIKYGGLVSDEIDDDTTHLIVDENVEITRICSILGLDDIPEHVKIVNTNWLSKCFREKSLICTDEFLVKRQIIKTKDDTDEDKKCTATNLTEDNDASKEATNDIKVDKQSTSTSNMFHVVKRRKIENSDSGDSSEYDPSDEEQHVEDVSVPSTERMLKVNIFLIMSTMCVNQTFIHMYMYVHFLCMLNCIWHNLKIPNRKFIKQHA
jgi:hypothetical protein